MYFNEIMLRAERVIHLIEFKNVSKTYPNGVKGLKNVNLTIEQGEFVYVIGSSGAGLCGSFSHRSRNGTAAAQGICRNRPRSAAEIPKK